MTTTVKKRLQAVVALLVSLMIMIGIMTTDILSTTVHAESVSYTIYFDTSLNDGQYAAWGAVSSVGIHVWKDSGTGSFTSISTSMTLDSGTLYYHTFTADSSINLKVQFMKNSTNSNYTNEKEVTNNGVYGVNDNNPNASKPSIKCFYVKSSTSTESGGDSGSSTPREDTETEVGYRVEKTKLWDYKYDTEIASGVRTVSGGTDAYTYYNTSSNYDYDKDVTPSGQDTGHRKGTRCANGEAVPYELLNDDISAYYGSDNSDYPLYFGHFWGTNKTDGSTNDQRATKRYGSWTKYSSDYNAWHQSANNSDSGNGGSGGIKEGLVSRVLSDGTAEGDILSKQGKVMPYFLDSYGDNFKGTIEKKTVASGGGFILKKTVTNGVVKYSYDSASDKNRYYNPTNRGFELSDAGPYNATYNASTSVKGFFPFNNTNIGGGSFDNARQAVNYGFGLRLDIPFNMTTDGKIEDNDGVKQDIKFEFSGDDDVWVFIDGVLVLDIGGDHGAESGVINFADETCVTKHGVVSGSGTTVSSQTLSQQYASAGKTFDESTFYNPNTPHAMSFFYMERGMFESNMHLSFMFIPTDDPEENPVTQLEVEKEVDTSAVNGTNGFFDTYENGATNVEYSLQYANGTAIQASDNGTARTNFTANAAVMSFSVNVGKNTSGLGDTRLLYVRDGNKATDANGTFSLVDSWKDTFNSDGTAPANGSIPAIDNSTVLKKDTQIKVEELVSEDVNFWGNTGSISVASLFQTNMQRKYGDTVVPDGSGNNIRPNLSAIVFPITGTATSPDNIKFINVMQTSTLQITKSLKSDTNGTVADATENTAKDFYFKVVLRNFGGISLEDGYEASTGAKRVDIDVVLRVKVTVPANTSTANSVVITNIPANTEYIITEETDASYTASGTLTGSLGISEAKVVEVTNTKTVTVENNVDIGIIKRWYPLNSSTTLPDNIKFLLQKSTNGTTWEDVTAAGTNGVVTLTSTGAKKYDASGNVVTGDGAYEYVEWTLATRITVPQETGVQYRILEYSEGDKALILLNEGLYATDCKAYYTDDSVGVTNVKSLANASYTNNKELVAWLVENKNLAANANESAITTAVQGLSAADKTSLTNAGATANPVIDLSVKNEYIPMGTAMPKTGARGVYAIITFGAFAITIAGVALLIYRKKLQTVNIYAVKGSGKD